MSTSAGLNEYFREAETWDADRTMQMQRGVRTAWRVAAGGWTCAMAACSALALLMPLKSVEPFVVRVDNSTGIVDVVPVYAGTALRDEAISRYFLSHYITVCERFAFATAESDYEECGSFHSAARNQAWSGLWARSNPESPLNVHKDGSSVRTEVQSVSFFTRASGMTDLAQVRYVKSLRQADGAHEQVSHWIATIQYSFTDPSKDPRTRRWNPLGFKIIEFRSEPEVQAESHGADGKPEGKAGRSIS